MTTRNQGLDDLGRIIDFSVLKTKVGGWINEHWDHNIILNKADPMLGESVDRVAVFGTKEPFVMSDNPTAENMAGLLAGVAGVLLHADGIDVVAVRLYETPTSWADFVV